MQPYGYKDITVWKRPDEFDTSRAPSLWGDTDIQPDGIKQGGLGNCWFLSAAAAMAEYPERIRKVFTNQSYPSNGLFMVEMFLRGEPVRIVVDD